LYKDLKKEPQFRFKVLLTVAFILLTGSNIFGYKAQTSSGVRIVLNNVTVQDKTEIIATIKDIDNSITRLVRKNKSEKLSPLTCKVIFLKRKLKKRFEVLTIKKRNITIYIYPDFISKLNRDRTMTDLFAVLLLRRIGIIPDSKYRKVPRWLTTGALEMMKKRRNAYNMIPGPPFFPGMHALATAESYPDIWSIINNPLKQQNGPAYNLYTESCELLLTVILRLRGDVSGSIIKMVRKATVVNTSAEEAFETTLGELIIYKNIENNPYFIYRQPFLSQKSEENLVQTWFEVELRRVSVNMFYPGNAEYARNEFRKSQTLRISVIIKNGDKETTETQSCSLEQLAGKWDSIVDKKVFINHLRHYFTMLKFEFPIFLRPAVSNIVIALKKLENGNKSDFTENIISAKNEFEIGLKKSIALEDYLKQQELIYIPPVIRYNNAFKFLELMNQRERKFWPGLNQYLNQIENEFTGN